MAAILPCCPSHSANLKLHFPQMTDTIKGLALLLQGMTISHFELILGKILCQSLPLSCGILLYFKPLAGWGVHGSQYRKLGSQQTRTRGLIVATLQVFSQQHATAPLSLLTANRLLASAAPTAPVWQTYQLCVTGQKAIMEVKYLYFHQHLVSASEVDCPL